MPDTDGEQQSAVDPMALAQMGDQAASSSHFDSAPDSPASTFRRNSLMSLGRLLVSGTAGLFLPAYLTHKLPVKTYSAWVLILQMSAYVGYLDFGVQTGVAKYVAEFEARNDPEGSSMRASAGFALMVCASILGVCISLILAWYVPNIFHEMPASLYRNVRISLVLVGVSLSFGLTCSVFSSVFLGQQKYAIPMFISLISRILYIAAILSAAYFQRGLVVMGGLVAAVNVFTGLLQFEAWRRYARHIHITLRELDISVVKKMLAYCSTLAIWTVGMLCVSGLDVTIVGKYDFSQTAFYSVAALPSNFALSIMGAALAPLLPTASALSVQRSASQMGEILSRVTRYSSILLVLSGLPLLVAGYWGLSVWVGHSYAVQTLPYLRILVIANILRSLCTPYSSMLIATDSQHVAIAAAIAEATANVVSSVYLARHIGAIGVAYGTLIGSFVSVGMQFAVSMHYTYSKFAITRARLFLTSLVRPALIAIPSLLLIQHWWLPTAPDFAHSTWAIWSISTLLITWYVAIGAGERSSFVKAISNRLAFRKSLSRN